MKTEIKKGCPLKPEDSKLTRQIHFRVREDEYQAIIKNVKYSKLKLGSYVSAAIKNAVLSIEDAESAIGAVAGITTSELIRTMVVSSTVTRAMSDEEFAAIKSIADSMAAIRKEARNIAGRGKGIRYAVVYADRLTAATDRAQDLLNKLNKIICK